jgi:hypothetical protein
VESILPPKEKVAEFLELNGMKLLLKIILLMKEHEYLLYFEQSLEEVKNVRLVFF